MAEESEDMGVYSVVCYSLPHMFAHIPGNERSTHLIKDDLKRILYARSSRT